MAECLQNCRFYRANISVYSSEVKKNHIKNYQYQRTFLLMTYDEKTSYFDVAPPGHTIPYKNIDNLFKKRYM